MTYPESLRARILHVDAFGNTFAYINKPGASVCWWPSPGLSPADRSRWAARIGSNFDTREYD